MTSKENFFTPDSPLSDQEQRYCRCVIKVGGKQCKAGEKCSSPYPICKKSTGQSANVSCGKYYNYPEFTDDYLRTYAIMRQIPIPEPYNKQEMLTNIANWKLYKG